MHQFNDKLIYHVRLPSNLHANSMKMKRPHLHLHYSLAICPETHGRISVLKAISSIEVKGQSRCLHYTKTNGWFNGNVLQWLINIKYLWHAISLNGVWIKHGSASAGGNTHTHLINHPNLHWDTYRVLFCKNKSSYSQVGADQAVMPATMDLCLCEFTEHSCERERERGVSLRHYIWPNMLL